MLPPESTTTTGGSKAPGSASSAATPAAPAGSTTCFARSRQSSRPRASAASDTATIRSAAQARIANGMSPGRCTAIPSAIVGAPTHLHRVPLRHRGDQPGHRRRLHADDLDLGVERVHGDRHARREPAAADRDEDRPHLRALLDDLEAERALACHDVLVVERVDEHRAGPGREPQRLLERVLDRRPVQDHLRAVAAGGLHLRQRRPLGHDHGRRGAEQPGRERDALRVVARRSPPPRRGPAPRRTAGRSWCTRRAP